ncbi:DUF2971 domain-containing protein [Citrobacter sp. Cy234]|uniref:DUF2971 domain-containing protein n=1 Tax=Enterobacteriaceae TaxID=543 RepID=UPI0015DBE3BA|nr:MULTISPECIES: DUF2971 domain-containing protein [Enterobacteriaceae]MDM2724712.1 DUF2971 domain-containing protein [Citrobacter sp. Cy234]BBS91560.1 hypothetical protein WP7S18C02_21750 [Klebsiella sp. WP7-S18-CRE-02]BBS96582.1 hypothetical protein WP7S18C03_21750 [Klebsiella sp. WP7-S18-CRE-03]BBT01614.1 hypothetical protein WP7S18E04_21760 [Klebsiella sp. WP7-S18-ESBL-04]
MMRSNIPTHLYKYKSFSVDSLDLLVSDKLFFANPNSFNDPLDCNPSIKDNIHDVDVLKDILKRLIIDNTKKELTEAASKIKYNGPRTLEKIESLGEREAAQVLSGIDDYLLIFDDNMVFVLNDILDLIKKNLMTNYTSGVLSLAQNYDCPLMWSHYADQHKGFCIGYDVSENGFYDIHALNYEGSRFITTQQVHDMLFGSSESIRKSAKKAIDEVVLLSKAPQWSYEKEHRVILDQGLQDNPFRLSDVTFGLRFKDSAKFSVMKALSGRGGDLEFYDMVLSNDSFELGRIPLSLENMSFRNYPTNNYRVYQDFLDISDTANF